MTTGTTLRREERAGLAIAVVLHVALAAAFLVQPAKRTAVPDEKTVTVTLAEDVGLESQAPQPIAESAAPTAPVLAPEPAPVVEPAPAPEPVVRKVEPAPTPPKPIAKPVTRPAPKPLPRAVASPKPRPTQGARIAAKPAPAKPSPARPAAAQPKKGGASRIGSDFLPGAGESSTTRETRPPASAIGASAKAGLFQAIARELRPKWQPPSGPDVELIVTKVRFRLNADGSLAGRPEIMRQSGVNDTNRAQAGRHGEQAIRAVQLAAPFDLPDEYYEAWKVVTVDFDWKLAQ